MPTIAIIDYGAGNLRSIHKALQWVAERPLPPTPSPEGGGGADDNDLPSLRRGGVEGEVGQVVAQSAIHNHQSAIIVTADPAVVATADAVVLPGVGAAGATMRRLAQCGLIAPLQAAATDGRPFLGVCLGLQLLFADLEEDGVAGLGVLPGRARRLPGGVKVPHMGWNTVGLRIADCGLRNWSKGIFAEADADAEAAATDADPNTAIPFRIRRSALRYRKFRISTSCILIMWSRRQKRRARWWA